MDNWVNENCKSLRGRTVALTGATGGLGRAACRYILALGGNLLLIARNPEKTRALRQDLLAEYPGSRIEEALCELTDLSQVKELARVLEKKPLDFLILNAGTYAVPRRTTSFGYDNVFTVNFLAHYYLVKALLPHLRQRKAKVIAVGSIAHSAVRYNPRDPDYALREGSARIYGNSKRFLMFALGELLRNEPEVDFAIAHPGISFTGITSHYPKYQLAIVKPSMKLLFMRPHLAVRGIIKAMFTDVPYLTWLGPEKQDIWGNPVLKPLTDCGEGERTAIFRKAEEMAGALLKK